ncbi:hypothetical protein, partial [Dubosiella newyorkensis]|uniref:hypothetical protein n=1 Tax=Dubosiella newyorkensis TaxID=1862672 RepID=UPI00272AC76B
LSIFISSNLYIFNLTSTIAQRLPIAGGALLGERVGIVFLDIVADAAFGRSGMKTNGHKRIPPRILYHIPK